MSDPISHRSLQPHAIGMIGVLVVQYLLGMFSSLFVSFPEGAKDKQLWFFAWRQIPIALHIIVGLLLFLGTLALLIRAVATKGRTWIIPSSIALGAVFIAAITGAIFISTQTDWYSFIMAISFIIALLSYFWGIYMSKTS
jgi:hypothetical protein